jgi:hypothetical protein
MNNNHKRTISNPSDWFVRLVSEAVAARRAQSRRGGFPKMGERCGPKQQRLGVVKIGWM